ncbi:MAG TPA: 2-amino-4-hydroxy-6-hydroxymethyldihydropteridine diphosphokinase [Steroidobacteraceae bacterium]|nr:2-amino-4-hydroxy-6-hydroxymethyldihydropteridine diphosphokinase [Steroidobacteraceae bacterium]
MPLIHVAIGSNIEPQQRMVQAAQGLRQWHADARFSPCYQNAAFGFAGPDFINAVVELNSSESVEQVLAQLRAIEQRCGRRRDDPKWAPRAMDLDLLLYGDCIERTPEYRLPRPDLLRRRYMLQPLADLAPGLRHPLTGRRIDAHLAELGADAPALTGIDLDLNRV